MNDLLILRLKPGQLLTFSYKLQPEGFNGLPVFTGCQINHKNCKKVPQMHHNEHSCSMRTMCTLLPIDLSE